MDGVMEIIGHEGCCKAGYQLGQKVHLTLANANQGVRAAPVMEARSPALLKIAEDPGEAEGSEAAEAGWSHAHCLGPDFLLCSSCELESLVC